MIAQIGLALLWLSAGLALVQFLFAAVATFRPAFWPEGAGGATGGDAAEWRRGVRAVAVVQALLVSASLAVLIALFLRSDMSVALVAAHSHSAKPWIYKLAGTWGNHEGSMLLWVSILAVAGAAVAMLERRVSPRTLSATLGAQAAISFGFYAFLLLASNPFARLNPAPADGQGLNPLLQDLGLAFHPPTLYLGYVGMSVAFSFAVGALLTREVNRDFARAMRPWVLLAWMFLTIGITAGSYWAYYELGWGGWWFWDPVENASLMPWLAATALLHSVNVLATRDALRAWTVMLAVVAFSMSMVGTFMVRSGILTSVHSFAVDPKRGSVLLLLMAIYIGGALILFATRIGTVRQGTAFDPVSREAGLVVNNLLISAILAIVLIGTLYPLGVEALSGEKLSVGPPYFNQVAGPLALILVALMPFGAMAHWRRDHVSAILKRGAAPLIVGVGLFIVLLIRAPAIGWLPWLGLSIAVASALASLLPLFGRNLRRTPLFTWGMCIAHCGVAVALAGMATESAFIQEQLIRMRVGETTAVGPFRAKLVSVEPVGGVNWTAIEATIAMQRGDGAVVMMQPQTRMYDAPPTETVEAAIRTRWDGQIYVNLGKPEGDDAYTIRLWWKPMVTLIWLGGGLIALGGLLAMVGRIRRDRGASQKRAAIHPAREVVA